MAKVNNKDKAPVIDESVLEETPPDINEPQTVDDTPENQDPNPDPIKEEPKVEKKAPIIKEKPEDIPDMPPPPVEKPRAEEQPQEVIETQEQKDQRYKAQQAEAQIQAAKNKDLVDKVDMAAKIVDPTIDELKNFVKQDGVDWDELTTFEQSMARKTYLSEKRFQLVNEAVQTTKRIDEWATKVDTFIDSTEDKPEFVALSGHEADFRKFAMKEAHRGVPIDSLLLPAFLQQLPTPKKNRGSLFEKAGGGEKEVNVGKITDADTNRTLRETNPREWRRQVKLGNIKIEE